MQASTIGLDRAKNVVEFRRIELITGVGRRRKWPAAEKARIVIESLEPGANVSEVARPNGVSPQQLFGWRREARALFGEGAGEADGTTPAAPAAPAPTPRPTSHRAQASAATAAEVPGDRSAPDCGATRFAATGRDQSAGHDRGHDCDAVVRISGQVETSALVAVLRAVRRAS